LVAPGSPWAQRIASPVRVILPTGPRTNLLQMSEDLANETVWATEGSVLRLVAATSPATWNVEREAEGYSVRPQQALVLHPRRTYTMTIDLKAGEAQSP